MIERADRVPPERLHAAFGEAFADYLIGPFALPFAAWPAFLARQGIDLPLGRVALAGDGAVAAFALVAPRPASARWRLATMGARPAARGSGAAPALLDDLVARATTAGVPAIELEVFAQNERARRLYAGRGFVAQHALHGFERVAGAAGATAIEPVPVDLAAASRWLERHAPADLPLQVLGPSLAGLGLVLTAWQHGSAQLVFGRAGDGGLVVYSLVDADARQADAAALVQVLLARHGGETIRVPALQRDDVGGRALRGAGFVQQPLHQLWMVKALPG